MQASTDDTALIRFEAQQWRWAGAKEAAIRDTFDLSATRFYQQIHAIVSDPARVAGLPAELGPVVNRIRRLEQQRRAQRTVRRAG